jgi:adenosyl cobinamide kinase/adenosyl cobinamide phosphate guanylyltransferase
MIKETPASIKVVAPSSKLNNDISKKIHKNLCPRSHTALIVGAPSSGKSSLMEYLLKSKDAYNKKYDCVILVAPATSLKAFEGSIWSDHPEEKKFSELTAENLREIIKMIEEQRDEEKNTLLVLDDVQSNLKDAWVEKTLIKLFSNFRHLRVSIWVLAQNLILVPKQVRILAQFYYLFQPHHRAELDYIRDEVLAWLPKQTVTEVIKFVYDEPHSFLLVNKKKKLLYKNFNELKITSNEKSNDIV